MLHSLRCKALPNEWEAKLRPERDNMPGTSCKSLPWWAVQPMTSAACIDGTNQSLIAAAGCISEALSEPLLVAGLEHVPQDVAQLHSRGQRRRRLL